MPASRPTRELVVLVDDVGVPIGEADKLEAHTEGWRHLAFSIFVFDAARRLLLQRRTLGKYHSGGLWANSCCGHPRPGEDVGAAAARRLAEELGLSCPLTELFTISYRVPVSGGLVENELNHVFVGSSDQAPDPNAEEVMELEWVSPQLLPDRMASRPERYAEWLKVTLPETLARMSTQIR